MYTRALVQRVGLDIFVCYSRSSGYQRLCMGGQNLLGGVDIRQNQDGRRAHPTTVQGELAVGLVVSGDRTSEGE